jgi:rubrerythrin
MQEPQQTTVSNINYDLASVLYHELQAAQTCSTYIKDAEQAGQQEVAQFFRQIHQEANKNAEQAKTLLVKLGS